MEGLRRREGTHGKKGDHARESEPRDCERWRVTPSFGIILVMSICDSHFDLEHAGCLASVQHYLVL